MNAKKPTHRMAITLTGVILAAALFAVETLQSAIATAPVVVDSASNDLLQTIDAVRAAEEKTNALNLKIPKSTSDDLSSLDKSWMPYGERILAVSAGAVVGFVAFNIITGGTTTTPAIASAVGAAGIRSAGAAVSTVAATSGSSFVSMYALISAAIGGVGGNYLFDQVQSTPAVDESPQF